MEVNDVSQWYVWSIKLGKYDLISQFIADKVPEIKNILYPTITTERHLKNGQIKKKKTPLYSGYLFLQYSHDPSNPTVWFKLKGHPFITSYVGPCTPADLVSVDSLQKLEAVNKMDSKSFLIGDQIRVNGGVFKGYNGKVVATLDKAVRVEMESHNKLVRFVFSPDDLDIIGRSGL